MPRVLVAPDSFKGTHSALEVARAMAAGVVRAGGEPIMLPLADGGEGTIDCVSRALGGRLGTVGVTDPLGASMSAEYLRVDDELAVIETARASGLGICPINERVARRASTFGTGQLIAAAAHSGCREVLVAMGGSATTDGGAGALEAIRRSGGLGDVSLRVLCDVTTPFELAADMYARQKGADDSGIEALSRRLHALAATYRKDPRGVRGTGCAGGLSGALWSEFDAELVPGADYILEVVHFDAYLSAGSIVITGEGCLDEQTFQGKLVSRVLAQAREHSKPCHAIAGTILLTADELEEAGFSSATPASTLAAIQTAAAACSSFGVAGEQVLPAHSAKSTPYGRNRQPVSPQRSLD